MGSSEQGVKTNNGRYQAIPRTLVFVRQGDDVLLLKGAPTKRLWADLYNGVGGHIEPGEDIHTAAHREVLEETGLSVTDLQLKAIVNIDAGDPGTGIILFVFTAQADRRETTASPEGTLHWLPVNGLDDLALVEDLKWLLPRVLKRPVSQSPLFVHYAYDAADRLIIRSAESQTQ